MNTSEVIIASARSLLASQQHDGSFPAGHNGPYYDEELPLRNTCHIMMLLTKAGKLSGHETFQPAAQRALDYITASERRPMGGAFWIRKDPAKDFSNGLIGQAWVIEALAYAAQETGADHLYALAEEVFLQHPFNEKTGRWSVLNVDGSCAPVDMTFNHQLWFAAAGSFLRGNELIQQRVGVFLDRLNMNLEIYDSGLVRHALFARRRIKRSLKIWLQARGKAAFTNEVINKAIGYHAFNTHGFCLLYQNTRTHPFWKSRIFANVLNFLQSDLYMRGLDYFVPDVSGNTRALPFNRFGYSYNPPGIEVALTVQTFKESFGGGHEDLIREWLGRQFTRTLDPASGLMSRQTDDKVTLAARIYELIRLEDYDFQLDQV